MLAKRGKYAAVILLTGVVSVLLFGCGEPAEQTGAKAEPVTLKALKGQTSGSAEEFQRYFADPVKKKYPNITLQYVELAKGQKMEDLLTAGDFPDIVFSGRRGAVNTITTLDIGLDLNPLVKKHKLDMGKFDQASLDAVKPTDPQGALYMIPYTANFYAMGYNKDIFDRFGVPYPKEGMIWEDVVELAKKVTRNESGVQYRGVEPGNVHLVGRGLSLAYVDPKTNKAIVNTDQWKRVFDLVGSMFEIPGNTPPQEKFKDSFDPFFTDKNIAMLPYYTASIVDRFQTLGENNQPFAWDLTTYPSFKESPGMTAEADSNVFMISKTSKHPDEAFQVIAFLAADEGVQTMWARMGKLPSLQIKGIEKLYGQDIPVLKGKNVPAIFKSKVRATHEDTDYDQMARNQLQAAFTDVVYKKLDVRTALRNAEEAINKNIANAGSK
jgi:multiple sugar transport system substrate-binding protein